MIIVVRRFGLGLAVGAILHANLAAQVTPPVRSDSAQADSARARQLADSIARARADSIALVDTLRTPLPAYQRPAFGDQSFRWDREQILSMGAVTLAEFLERVPGVHSFRTGFISSPAAAAYAGCFSCIRVFRDGVELALLNSRNANVLDLTEVRLWNIDEIFIERGPTEIRVYLTTIGATRTIPFTRIDYFSGSDETRVFRGLFGKRYRRGEVFQIAGERFATSSRVNSGSGDEAMLTGRIGVVRERWGIDAYFNRASPTRLRQERLDGLVPHTAFEGSRTDAYIRASLGTPGSGSWLQLIGSSMQVEENTPGTGPAPPASEDDPPQPPADTARSEAQYLFAGGTYIGGIDLAATARFRSTEGLRTNEFTATASTLVRGVTLAANVRRDTRDSVTAAELSAVARPLTFLRLYGAVGQREPLSASSGTGAVFAHAEAGLRLGEVWVTAGALTRDSIALAAPVLFDTAFSARGEGNAVGGYARLEGRLWRSIHADVRAIQWDAEGIFRPQFEMTSRLYLDSSWLTRFPNGTFHVYADIALDSRSEVQFPRTNGDPLVVPASSSLSAKLEIRILSGVISWHSRNLRAEQFTQVPGFEMPRRLNIYGIRWELWN